MIGRMKEPDLSRFAHAGGVVVPALLRREEAAAILRYRSTRSVDRLIGRGELAVVRLNDRQLRIPAQSVAALIERRTERAGAQDDLIEPAPAPRRRPHGPLIPADPIDRKEW
jgi:hypothetical protein